MGAPNRNQMALDILDILIASTETELAKVKENAKQYGLRTFRQMWAMGDYNKGMFVGVGRGPLDALTMSAAKQDHTQYFEVQIYTIGYDPVADAKLCVALAEEIEVELYKTVNMRLLNGGDFLGVPEFLPGPPMGRANSNLTLHFVLMELKYRKTTTL